MDTEKRDELENNEADSITQSKSDELTTKQIQKLKEEAVKEKKEFVNPIAETQIELESQLNKGLIALNQSKKQEEEKNRNNLNIENAKSKLLAQFSKEEAIRDADTSKAIIDLNTINSGLSDYYDYMNNPVKSTYNLDYNTNVLKSIVNNKNQKSEVDLRLQNQLQDIDVNLNKSFQLNQLDYQKQQNNLNIASKFKQQELQREFDNAMYKLDKVSNSSITGYKLATITTRSQREIAQQAANKLAITKFYDVVADVDSNPLDYTLSALGGGLVHLIDGAFGVMSFGSARDVLQDFMYSRGYLDPRVTQMDLSRGSDFSLWERVGLSFLVGSLFESIPEMYMLGGISNLVGKGFKVVNAAQIARANIAAKLADTTLSPAARNSLLKADKIIEGLVANSANKFVTKGQISRAFIEAKAAQELKNELLKSIPRSVRIPKVTPYVGINKAGLKYAALGGGLVVADFVRRYYDITDNKDLSKMSVSDFLGTLSHAIVDYGSALVALGGVNKITQQIKSALRNEPITPISLSDRAMEFFSSMPAEGLGEVIQTYYELQGKANYTLPLLEELWNTKDEKYKIEKALLQESAFAGAGVAGGINVTSQTVDKFYGEPKRIKKLNDFQEWREENLITKQGILNENSGNIELQRQESFKTIDEAELDDNFKADLKATEDKEFTKTQEELNEIQNELTELTSNGEISKEDIRAGDKNTKQELQTSIEETHSNINKLGEDIKSKNEEIEKEKKNQPKTKEHLDSEIISSDEKISNVSFQVIQEKKQLKVLENEKKSLENERKEIERKISAAAALKSETLPELKKQLDVLNEEIKLKNIEIEEQKKI